MTDDRDKRGWTDERTMSDSFERRFGRFGLVIAIAAASLIACGPAGPSHLKLKFEVARKANSDHPLRVDVVVAYDPELLEDLDRLTAAEWFAQRDQRLRNNPGQQSFHTWRWELTPGLEVPNIDLDLRGVPAQGILFADYLSRGKHSARFDPRMAQAVQFRQDAFRMVTGKANEPESKGWRPPVGWGTIILGSIGLGLGTYFAIQSKNASDETKELYERDSERYEELKNDISTYNTGAIISFAVGATLVVAGAAILLWPESDESPFRDVPVEDDESGASLGIKQW